MTRKCKKEKEGIPLHTGCEAAGVNCFSKRSECDGVSGSVRV